MRGCQNLRKRDRERRSEIERRAPPRYPNPRRFAAARHPATERSWFTAPAGGQRLQLRGVLITHGNEHLVVKTCSGLIISAPASFILPSPGLTYILNPFLHPTSPTIYSCFRIFSFKIYPLRTRPNMDLDQRYYANFDSYDIRNHWGSRALIRVLDYRPKYFPSSFAYRNFSFFLSQ